MLPRTGFLRRFGLTLTEGGFTLRFPRRHAADQLLPLPEYPKLLATFRQYGDWLETLGISYAGALNDAIQAGKGSQVVLVSEALHEQHISSIAGEIARAPGRDSRRPHRRPVGLGQDDVLQASHRPASGARRSTVRPRARQLLRRPGGDAAGGRRRLRLRNAGGARPRAAEPRPASARSPARRSACRATTSSAGFRRKGRRRISRRDRSCCWKESTASIRLSRRGCRAAGLSGSTPRP